MNISPLATAIFAVQGAMLLITIILIIGCVLGARADLGEANSGN